MLNALKPGGIETLFEKRVNYSVTKSWLDPQWSKEYFMYQRLWPEKFLWPSFYDHLTKELRYFIIWAFLIKIEYALHR
jgi:hypothetical protein